MVSISEMEDLLFKLTWKKAKKNPNISFEKINIFANNGIDYNQFNEILLSLGYNRITENFFQFLCDGEFDYSFESKIENFDTLKEKVELFQKMALFLVGNIKHAFNKCSSDPLFLKECLSSLTSIDESHFKSRNEPFLELIPIEPENAYYLGYMIQDEIKNKLKEHPESEHYKKEQNKIETFQRLGIQNHYAYLNSNFLDVYIATSMRKHHEYISVSRITKEIFTDEQLVDLSLRYFDPTQAVCSNRIDKGLSEALMLKKAKCTVYLVQESDTLGKDSELASTLAQGKMVIAYIPRGDEAFIDKLITDLKATYPDKNEKQLLLEQLEVFDPTFAWNKNNSFVWDWIKDTNNIDILELKRILVNKITAHYDNRANTLIKKHPLGIQVNLSSGVANGVLVVRDTKQCAKLIRSILLKEMSFSIESHPEEGEKYLLLKEKISGCIFRVITSDETLTNAFWNFYLKK